MADIFKLAGFLAWIAGAWFIYTALNINVGVSVPADAAAAIGTDTVANSHLMHVQLMTFLAGALLTLDGSVLLIGGFLLGKDDPPPDIEG